MTWETVLGFGLGMLVAAVLFVLGLAWIFRGGWH